MRNANTAVMPAKIQKTIGSMIARMLRVRADIKTIIRIIIGIFKELFFINNTFF